ncbi:MAG: hypothetical protein WCO00_18325 [Rhodospirillaceae bacterium]
MPGTNRPLGSELWAISSGDEFKAAVTLWCRAWHQVPAASLPDDDRLLASFAGYGRDIKSWLKVRPMALHGFRPGRRRSARRGQGAGTSRAHPSRDRGARDQASRSPASFPTNKPPCGSRPPASSRNLLGSMPTSKRAAAAVIRTIANPAVSTVSGDVVGGLMKVNSYLTQPFT